MAWLTQPPIGSTGWGVDVNTNFDLIEKELRPTRSAQVGDVIDFSGDAIKFRTLDDDTTFTISNPILGCMIVLELDGVHTVTLPASVNVVNGDYCPNLGKNILYLLCTDAATPEYQGVWTVEV